MIVGLDLASPGLNSRGDPIFWPYEARELAEQYGGELVVKVIRFREFVYMPDENLYEEDSAMMT